MSELCPMGRNDYDACFAPFRYCPVKGCGRSEMPPCGFDGCKVTEEHEHVGDGGYRLTESAAGRSGAWSQGIIDQTLGEPVLKELREMPVNFETLDSHARWVEHKIHRVVWRHAFTDHDCQVTGCLSMYIAESQEIQDVIIEAYERGRRDSAGAPWTPGEYE